MKDQPLYHILICESNEQHLQNLEQMILNFHKNSLQSMKLHCYSKDSEELQNDLILSAMFYIIIIDFQFEGRNGVPLAKKVRQQNPDVPIIFFSEKDTYPVEAWELLAVGVLKKTAGQDIFKKLYYRAWLEAKVGRQPTRWHSLEFVVNKKRIRLKLWNIISLEKNEKYIYITTKTAVYKVRDTMIAMEQRLSPIFLRIGKGIIVNMDEILYFEGRQVFLSSGQDFFITRKYEKQVFEYYRRYCMFIGLCS